MPNISHHCISKPRQYLFDRPRNRIQRGPENQEMKVFILTISCSPVTFTCSAVPFERKTETFSVCMHFDLCCKGGSGAVHLFPMSHPLNCPKPDGWQRSGTQSWQRQALISAQESPLTHLKGVKLQKRPVEGLYPLCNFTRRAKMPPQGSITQGERRGARWVRVSRGCGRSGG